jgi:hypothetical protein
MAGELDLVASALRADAGDVDVFFDVLVGKLAEALPEAVEVERGGFLGRGKPEAVSVALGDARYEARRQKRGVACQRRKVVRGIALKTEELEVGSWIDALSADLVDEAARSDRARAALQGLLDA